ncbi:MAG: phosphopentomutase [Planctomycetes bacterium]|nr:phosphopentomutase [Planctomycetota bacterium]
MNRAIILVLDSVGIGALPDADKCGDAGSHTLGNIARVVGGLNLPNLERLGLGKIEAIQGVSPDVEPQAFHGKMAEASAGKDTTTGHWEIAGVVTEKPFPTYPKGFPADVLREFGRRIGRGCLGNKTASGTEIISQLGPVHIKTGLPIVYTSADSVFQVAACEDVIPVEELHRMCEAAREVLAGENAVCRVIARPFVVKGGAYVRTERRKDFSLAPPKPTLLDIAKDAGLDVIGIGKIGDIFAHRGVTAEIHTADNAEGITHTVEAIRADSRGLIFTNLVDYDVKFGHRNDAEGFARALREFDDRLPEILAALKDEDLLFLTADHGCDPTTPSTDHSREYVPLLVFGKRLGRPQSLGLRPTFADLGATAAEALGLKGMAAGTSFFSLLTGP